MAQLVELLVLTLEVCGSNPVIGKLLYRTFVFCHCKEKTEIKKKRPGMPIFFKKKCRFAVVKVCQFGH